MTDVKDNRMATIYVPCSEAVNILNFDLENVELEEIFHQPFVSDLPCFMAGAGILWDAVSSAVPEKEIEQLDEALESDYTHVFRMSKTIAKLAIDHMPFIKHGDLINRAAIGCGHMGKMQHHAVREALSLLAMSGADLSPVPMDVECGYRCLQEYYNGQHSAGATVKMDKPLSMDGLTATVNGKELIVYTMDPLRVVVLSPKRGAATHHAVLEGARNHAGTELARLEGVTVGAMAVKQSG